MSKRSYELRKRKKFKTSPYFPATTTRRSRASRRSQSRYAQYDMQPRRSSRLRSNRPTLGSSKLLDVFWFPLGGSDEEEEDVEETDSDDNVVLEEDEIEEVNSDNESEEIESEENEIRRSTRTRRNVNRYTPQTAARRHDSRRNSFFSIRRHLDYDSSSSSDDDFKRSGSSRYSGATRPIPINLSEKGRSKPGSQRADIDPMSIDTSIGWESIGGLDHHIQSLKEMVAFPLMYPEIFNRFGITPPRGVLFYGPPGTGKTYDEI